MEHDRWIYQKTINISYSLLMQIHVNSSSDATQSVTAGKNPLCPSSYTTSKNALCIAQCVTMRASCSSGHSLRAWYTRCCVSITCPGGMSETVRETRATSITYDVISAGISSHSRTSKYT